MNTEDVPDILTEMLEVYLNHILYVRDIYPEQIFQKRRVYNTPIYVSIYPPLNAYLYKVLRTVRELNRAKTLQRLELLIYRDEQFSYERYNFHLSECCTKTLEEANDRFLVNFEEQLRASLYTLAERLKPLPKLQKDAKFKVLLHTPQAAFIRLSQNSNYQDFPWLHETQHKEPDKDEIALLPLTKIDAFGVEISAEVFSTPHNVTIEP